MLVVEWTAWCLGVLLCLLSSGLLFWCASGLVCLCAYCRLDCLVIWCAAVLFGVCSGLLKYL